jgi:hypothetical protein
VQVDKRPTRLPEACFFTFNPVVMAMADDDPAQAGSNASSWGLTVLGSSMDPLDVLGRRAHGPDPVSRYLDSEYGGSPHLRGVEAARYSDDNGTTAGRGTSFELTSLDVPVMCVGKATPFVTPRTEPPDMSHGVSWNIYQNLWNTNYAQWYPFDETDQHIRSRFRMQLN